MKKLISFILGFFRLAVLPSGLTPDKSALYGLLAQEANDLAQNNTVANITTAGTNSTLTAAQALAGTLLMAAGASGGFTITLPSTAALLSALGPSIPTDGSFSKAISFVNNSIGQTGTLTAGDASTTVTGTATIATATTRTFLMTVTSATTIKFQNLGSVSL